MCHEFYKQYKYNTKVDITRQDLETTKQDSSESFHAFITRWRTKAAQMTIRPNEEEQLNMIVKNLLPTYNKYLFARYFPNFKTLIAAGTQIEEASITVGLCKISWTNKSLLHQHLPINPTLLHELPSHNGFFKNFFLLQTLSVPYLFPFFSYLNFISCLMHFVIHACLMQK